MANGTLVPIYARRIHKSNAHVILEDANQDKELIHKELVAAVAMTPKLAPTEVVSYIDDLMEWYDTSYFNALVASNIIEFPEDCEDDLEGDGQ